MHLRNHLRGAAGAVTALVCAMTLVAGGAIAPAATPSRSGGSDVPSPTVTPATGGGGVPAMAGFTTFDPADVGYRQSEIVLSGTAKAYQPAAPLGPDGKFSVTEASTAPYTTRAVVMRPAERRRFNGTVVVEWLNVSAGADASPDWLLAHTQLIREGFAWVGVSAQQVGVNALRSEGSILGVPFGDPARYARLSHPGDSYSYDIFSQAGQAIWDNPRAILGGLRPEQLVAVGESQSAGCLATYIDAVHPLAHVYDGFLVHSTFGGGAPLSQAPQAAVPVPTPSPIRDDLDTPVLMFQTETDVARGNLAARQPDTPMFRLWEVAGTAHYDLYGLNLGWSDTGDGRGGDAVLASMLNPTNQPIEQVPALTCAQPVNTGLAHYVLDAAFHWLHRWVADGARPPMAPRLQTTGTNPVTFATDAHGNTLGGIRTPAVDAPIAALSGQSQGGPSFCAVFGSTVPFTDAQLTALYPSHHDFVSAWARATRSAQRAGFLTRADARELIAAAARSQIGRDRNAAAGTAQDR